MAGFDEFRALSFDCYGTLVDWEIGIVAALRPVLNRAGVSVDDDRLLALYGELEAEFPKTPWSVLAKREKLTALGLEWKAY